jgi:hypothetical protein
MPSQYSRPLLVLGAGDSEVVHALRRKDLSGGEDSPDEVWLQELLFTHPELLPIDEVEPVFGPVIPVCRELPTPAGPIDLLYANESGLLTLVECKLWRNPEARREVVGQILDYAKELAKWSYDELQNACKRATPGIDSLYKTVGAQSDERSEPQFIDAVSRNLKRGRFLLLIVGDGIRESVEDITDFLERHAHLNFSFALVEAALFTLPLEVGGGLLVQPRVLCRTSEIVRTVVRLEGRGIVAAEATPSGSDRGGRKPRTRISEQVFYENVAVPPPTKAALQSFFAKAQELGLCIDPGENSLMLKSEDGRLNFATFRVDGTVRNYRIASMTERLGIPEVGEGYLSGLAALFEGGAVHKGSDRWVWTVKKNGRDLRVEECLAVQDKWLDLIMKTLREVGARGN